MKPEIAQNRNLPGSDELQGHSREIHGYVNAIHEARGNTSTIRAIVRQLSHDETQALVDELLRIHNDAWRETRDHWRDGSGEWRGYEMSMATIYHRRVIVAWNDLVYFGIKSGRL